MLVICVSCAGLCADEGRPVLPAHLMPSEPSRELSLLDEWIKMAQNSLEDLKTIRSLTVRYQELRERSIQNPDNLEILLRTAKVARHILDIIEEDHLGPNFEPEFLNEIRLFANISPKAKS